MNTPRTKELITLMKMVGATHPQVQRTILAMCREGEVDEATRAVATQLIDQGISVSEVPPPANPFTQELGERVIASAASEAKKYLINGGILLSRRFVSPEDLVKAMCFYWKALLPVQDVVAEVTVSDEALQKKLQAITARFLEPVLRKYQQSSGEYIIPKNHIEAVCLVMAKRARFAREEPERAAHILNFNVDPVDPTDTTWILPK